MTYEALKRRAKHYDKKQVFLLWLLRGTAFLFAALAAIVMIHIGHEAAAIFSIVSAGLFIGSFWVSYAKSEKEMFRKYIHAQLTQASATRRARLQNELDEARLCQMAPDRRLSRVERAKALEDARRHELVMTIELSNFNYEYEKVLANADRAIDAFTNHRTPGLIETTEFAHAVNGLIANALAL